MQTNSEVVIATLPGESEFTRIDVVLVNCDEGSVVEMRDQTYGEGVGWYTQKAIQLSPDQLGGLRLALGKGNPGLSPSRSRRETSFVPRVVHAESA